MKKKKLTFKLAYLIYLIVLVVLVTLATFYVSRILKQYENALPEKNVEAAVLEMEEKALDKTLWYQYILPDTNPGKYEENIDIAEEYSEDITLEDFLDSLSEEEQRDALIHLSLLWAEKQKISIQLS